jgi:hypothetical protein
VNVAGGAGAAVSPAAVAHYMGAPWPGACDADGYCSLAVQYGGELGRWLYNTPAAAALGSAAPFTFAGASLGDIQSGSNDGAGDDADVAPDPWTFASAALGDSGALGDSPGRQSVAALGDGESSSPSTSTTAADMFSYDAGARETCEVMVPASSRAQRQRSIVSLPISAHLTSLHDWHEDEVAAAVVPLMCQPSKPCSLKVRGRGVIVPCESSTLCTRYEAAAFMLSYIWFHRPPPKHADCIIILSLLLCVCEPQKP